MNRDFIKGGGGAGGGGTIFLSDFTNDFFFFTNDPFPKAGIFIVLPFETSKPPSISLKKVTLKLQYAFYLDHPVFV